MRLTKNLLWRQHLQRCSTKLVNWPGTRLPNTQMMKIRTSGGFVHDLLLLGLMDHLIQFLHVDPDHLRARAEEIEELEDAALDEGDEEAA